MQGWGVILVTLGWLGVLFLVAWLGDRFYRGNTAWRPWVYSFSIAVYCTSWTFFGTVGQVAAICGLLFLSISVPFWCLCLVGAYWGA